MVSEFGGPDLFSEPYSEAYHANRVQKYLEVIDSLRIIEAYYFTLVESGSSNPAHVLSGLINTELNEKLAYDVFKRFK